MHYLVKKVLYTLPIKYIPYKGVENLYALCLLPQVFDVQIRKTSRFDTREELWIDFINNCGLRSTPITYLEFGVWRGESIISFSGLNTHSKSRFVGFDSFEGLPEPWRKMRQGAFSANGNVPVVEDDRVSFVKGWFWDTVSAYLAELRDDVSETLVVHYDADLFSSTLYVMAQIDSLKREYFAIFDEFTGDEERALKAYLDSFGASVEFISHRRYVTPIQVVCKIKPRC